MRHSLKFVSFLVAAIPAIVCAQPSAHYVPGTEGIRAASLPPPGLYIRDYNMAYRSTRLNNGRGRDVGPGNFSAFTYANAPRLVYITPTKFLGGFVGVDALLPFVYQSVRAGGFDHDTFGVGDFFAEASLSWHLDQFDFATAAGIWAPTGDSAKPPTTRAGAGFWTPMLTAGGTWYVDREKTWAVSALNRYEFNTEQRDTDITPGQVYTLEYGLSKTLQQTIDVGVVGYYQEQVTADSGPRSTATRDRVAGIGPELGVAFPKATFFVSIRYLYEFMAENRAEGHTVSLTLTKKL